RSPSVHCAACGSPRPSPISRRRREAPLIRAARPARTGSAPAAVTCGPRSALRNLAPVRAAGGGVRVVADDAAQRGAVAPGLGQRAAEHLDGLGAGGAGGAVEDEERDPAGAELRGLALVLADLGGARLGVGEDLAGGARVETGGHGSGAAAAAAARTPAAGAWGWAGSLRAAAASSPASTARPTSRSSSSKTDSASASLARHSTASRSDWRPSTRA